MAAQKTNKRRWWIALVALIVVAAILAGLYFLFRAAEGGARRPDREGIHL